MNKQKIAELSNSVEEILKYRHSNINKIDSKINQIENARKSLNSLIKYIEDLKNLEKDKSEIKVVDKITKNFTSFINALDSKYTELDNLKKEFERNTINIGVSGDARVGKSTTLQSISGLSDVQIPTGTGLAVTAVSSEIYNSSSNIAKVTFRSQKDFINDYIIPHYDNIKSKLDSSIEINTILDIKNLDLPETLGSNVLKQASDSLEKLKAAKKSIDSFEALLTGKQKDIALEDLHEYVAYPTDEELNQEDINGNVCSRKYLAVKSVEIFCSFPGLNEMKIGLVDLPGLGEIGKEVARTHLKGLGSKVDQIFLIMKPDESKGMVDNSIFDNIDNLSYIQPGVKKRNDLISMGINIFPGVEKTVETLSNDFERKVNAQRDDKFEILKYHAKDSDEVDSILTHLLDKISKRLPSMDEQQLRYVLGDSPIEVQMLTELNNLHEALIEINKNIPAPLKLQNKRINEVSKKIIDGYNKFENELSLATSEESQAHKEFKKDVLRIHGSVNNNIKNGLFYQSVNDWKNQSLGEVDYLNYYREEDRRVRREIIDAYSDLDIFYKNSVNSFKINILSVLLQNAGSLYEFFQVDQYKDSRILLSDVKREFSSKINDQDLISALELIENIFFSFKNNVFLEIKPHIENLLNPEEFIDKKFKVENVVITKRDILGGVGDVKQKVDKTFEFLVKDATEANDNIKDALLKHNDRFNEYLATIASFYVDYLIRKDEDNFRYYVVNSLIDEYPDCFFAKEDSMLDDPRRDKIKQLIGLINNIKGNISVSAKDLEKFNGDSYFDSRESFNSSNIVYTEENDSSTLENDQQPSIDDKEVDVKRDLNKFIEFSSEDKSKDNDSNIENKDISFQNSQIVDGTITQIKNGVGVSVEFDGNKGFIAIANINGEYIEDINSILTPGQQIKAEVIGYNKKRKFWKLSCVNTENF